MQCAVHMCKTALASVLEDEAALRRIQKAAAANPMMFGSAVQPSRNTG